MAMTSLIFLMTLWFLRIQAQKTTAESLQASSAQNADEETKPISSPSMDHPSLQVEKIARTESKSTIVTNEQEGGQLYDDDDRQTLLDHAREVLRRRENDTGTEAKKRTWEVDKLRVWGRKRQWNVDNIRVWGKRTEEKQKDEKSGEKAKKEGKFPLPMRDWWERNLEKEQPKKRQWQVDNIRVWGKRNPQMNGWLRGDQEADHKGIHQWQTDTDRAWKTNGNDEREEDNDKVEEDLATKSAKIFHKSDREENAWTGKTKQQIENMWNGSNEEEKQ